MLAQDFTSNDWFDIQKPLSDSETGEILKRWKSDKALLGFGYFRSQGGVMQTGLATVLRVTRALLTLDTQGSRLALVLKDAQFMHGNLGFMTPDFRAVYDIDGLSIFLGNHDWVFLFEGSEEIDVSMLTQQFGPLR